MSIFCCCYPRTHTYVQTEPEGNKPKETDPLMQSDLPFDEGSVGGTFDSSRNGEQVRAPIAGTPPPSHTPRSFTTPTGEKGAYEGGGNVSPGGHGTQFRDGQLHESEDVSVGSPTRWITPPPSHTSMQPTTPPANQTSYQGGGELSPARPVQSTGISRGEEIPANPLRSVTPPPSHTPTQPTTPPANLSSYQGGGDISPQKK